MGNLRDPNTKQIRRAIPLLQVLAGEAYRLDWGIPTELLSQKQRCLQQTPAQLSGWYDDQKNASRYSVGSAFNKATKKYPRDSATQVQQRRETHLRKSQAQVYQSYQCVGHFFLSSLGSSSNSHSAAREGNLEQKQKMVIVSSTDKIDTPAYLFLHRSTSNAYDKRYPTSSWSRRFCKKNSRFGMLRP